MNGNPNIQEWGKREMDDKCLVYQFGVAYFDSKKIKWILKNLMSKNMGFVKKNKKTFTNICLNINCSEQLSLRHVSNTVDFDSFIGESEGGAVILIEEHIGNDGPNRSPPGPKQLCCH